MKPLSTFLTLYLLIIILFFGNCKKNSDPLSITGSWTSGEKKTFEDIVMWTASGKLTDQNMISAFLERTSSEYFSLDKAPETIEGSATFHFEPNYVVVEVNGEKDTTQYLVKNESQLILKYDVQAFTTFPTNICQRLVDSLLAYPSTTICEPLPPIGNMPGAIKCVLPQYYPIEINGNRLRLAVLNFHIWSGLKNEQGQIVAGCQEARSNIANVITGGLVNMLKPGDTIVTQRAFLDLKKL